MHHNTKKQFYPLEIYPQPSFLSPKESFSELLSPLLPVLNLNKEGWKKKGESILKDMDMLLSLPNQFQVHSNWVEKHI